MTTSTRVPLELAEMTAYDLVSQLAPFCERAAIVGSIRRRRLEVKDVEILAVPKVEPLRNLFGDVFDQRNYLDIAVESMLDAGQLSKRLDRNGKPAVGERYKRLIYDGLAVDLFSCLPPAQWGLLMVIRTGPAEFSKRLVTQKRFGGLLPNHWSVRDGAMWNGLGELVPTPEEADVFRAIELDWIEPEVRS